MFCREGACEKPICHLCLVKSHKFHDVVDLEEERKEKYALLVKDIEEVSKLLTENKKTIRAFQENLKNRYENSLIMLRKRKEEVTEHMDKLEAELREDKTDQDTEIRNDMETIDINIDVIQNIQGHVNKMATLDDINKKSEIVNTLHEEIRKRIRVIPS